MKTNRPASTPMVGRREFLRWSALGGLGLAAGGFGLGLNTGWADERRPIDLVRVGIIGIGARGIGHVRELLKVEGVEIRALCDVDESKVVAAQKLIQKAGKPKAKTYTRGQTDYRRLCESEDLDLVLNAAPWALHTPICLLAMNHGKHAATEVPASQTIEECWALVETAEKTGKQCIMLENCCYDRPEMMIFNMVRHGLFGSLLYGEGGYLHDRRKSMFADSGSALWRTHYAEVSNCDLYPTHGLAPIAQYMNVNRGNQFTRLVSMSSPSLCLNEYAAKKFGPDSPQAKQKYTEGDVVSTLIQTVAGQTIALTHDTHSPHPYSRKIALQGTRGTVRVYPEEKIYLEGTAKKEEWEPLEKYREQYEHPIWKQLSKKSKGGGHGGMDYIQAYRLIRAFRKGVEPDMDVYDAAAWSAVVALSGESIAKKNAPVEFPDFTRGKWKQRPPLELLAD
ncbi:MAG: Gfo/Idh/MocA family oxidoreductase [Thermoguttaceae bacterium]